MTRQEELDAMKARAEERMTETERAWQEYKKQQSPMQRQREKIDALRDKVEIAKMTGHGGAVAAGNVIFWLIVAAIIIGVIMWIV